MHEGIIVVIAKGNLLVGGEKLGGLDAGNGNTDDDWDLRGGAGGLTAIMLSPGVNRISLLVTENSFR